MSKSTNRRKSIAIALAVLGVAGLSLASASNLSLLWNGTTQAGTIPVTADCQSAVTGNVKLKFSDPLLGANGYAPASVVLTNIDPLCKSKSLAIAYKTTGAYLPLTVSPTTLSASLSATDLITIALPALTAPASYNDIASFAVSISG